MKTQGQVLGLVLAGQAMRGPVLMKNTWESRKVKRKNIKKTQLEKIAWTSRFKRVRVETVWSRLYASLYILYTNRSRASVLYFIHKRL